ncbi:NAD(P)/FAD-dependent oxidoreductase [Reinekea sp. G2M2-21]|uniref:NAD(P)/FAD-dependent oxidoreductase n=1 Tax=Reinekea sp. G2M2-21 TaxID=2788942 RepID=UPI0018A9ACCA|nr:FAD-dependent oxidoreductase [Reinekea sp. G2M2-21]
MSKQKIAIIGGGISGMTAARYLYQDHDIELYEFNDYIGGHTHTLDVKIDGKTYPVNTGFIVYNDWVYHNFNKLMSELDVARIPTEMSFSVSDEVSGLEYNGHNLDTLFAQRKNIVSPSFLKMIRDILKFNKESLQDLADGNLDEALTLKEYFKQKGLGQTFIDKYIIPMGAAIWSSGEADMLDFPALFFVRFFKNHGLLSVKDRPQWYVLEGGSRSYVEPLIAPFKDKVHANARILAVTRSADSVTLTFDDHTQKQFDQVIFACHSDQALTLMDDATDTESDILKAIPYSQNEVVLHTDEALLPKSRKAWAAWNYHLGDDKTKPASLTYNMNILQSFHGAPVTFCVTLNRTEKINPEKIIARFNYGHPIFNKGSVHAQSRYHEIGNKNRTHFCGAYWFNGFHEDGVNSALRVVEDIKSQKAKPTQHVSTEIPVA